MCTDYCTTLISPHSKHEDEYVSEHTLLHFKQQDLRNFVSNIIHRDILSGLSQDVAPVSFPKHDFAVSYSDFHLCPTGLSRIIPRGLDNMDVGLTCRWRKSLCKGSGGREKCGVEAQRGVDGCGAGCFACFRHAGRGGGGDDADPLVFLFFVAEMSDSNRDNEYTCRISMR